MEPIHIHNEKDDDHYESEEILDLLPPRIREISGSSTAMESFNLMNDDLISHRIIPPLHSRLRILIANAARPALIANRLRHLVDSAPPSPRKCSLLFRLIPKVKYAVAHEMKFIECVIRDKRMSPFPHHEFTALTIPHIPPVESFDGHPDRILGSFVEVIGNKIIFFYVNRPNISSFILNAEHNSDRAFRALDIPPIVEQFPLEALVCIFKKAIVGDRLIVLLIFPNQFGANKICAFMLSLDVNTEIWSVLPQSPELFDDYFTPIPWKGKLYLYLVDINWYFRRIVEATDVVPMHFDFQSNMWVMGGDDNTAFARCFMTLYPNQEFVSPRCMISSKSGTLYALSNAPENVDSDVHPIGNIYAMDDLTRGWRQIECRKTEHAQRVDPFKLPGLPRINHRREYLRERFNSWEINEHDILVVVLESLNPLVQLSNVLWARYAWWIFNKDDGVKNYGCHEFELSRSSLENVNDITVLKLEM